MGPKNPRVQVHHDPTIQIREGQSCSPSPKIWFKPVQVRDQQ